MENTFIQGTRWKKLFFIFPFISSAHALNTTPSLPNETAQNVEFDSTFLNVGDKSTIDLSRFANGASALPGTYLTAVYVNNDHLGNYQIQFKTNGDNIVLPCISDDIVKNIPFNDSKLPADFLKQEKKQPGCINLTAKVEGTHVAYDSNEQRLDIAMPQIYLLRNARGQISKDRWDSGIPAALLSYNASAYSSESGGSSYNSLYANLSAGLNIAGWYLRHNGSWNWVEEGEKKYSAINTYMQHSIPALNSRMLLGQANTSGQLFDTLPFTGAQLASDEAMLPGSLRGYAPEIRGVARTNARVTVRQSNQVIYETTVPPGEFLISDLYPTGYGGNLVVTIRESDGSERHFEVPYSSVAQLLRPGNSRYSLTAGRLRNSSLAEEPMFYQGTLQYGLSNMLTAYGGFQASPNYYALQSGLALGTELGAFALDVTHARASLENHGNTTYDSAMSGQSFQLSYNHTVSETSSQVSLAAYRFSTSGYMDLMTAMQTREALAEGELSMESLWRAKNRFVVTVSQGLPDSWGRLYVSSSLQDYWNRSGSSKQYQLGYSSHYKSLSWGVSINRTYSLNGTTENNYQLNFSLPLDNRMTGKTSQLRMDLARNSSGRTSEQASLSGSAGKFNQFSYGITATNANQGVGSSGSLNGSWTSPVTSLSASWSKGSGHQSFSAGLNGTVLGHAGGVTLSPYTSDTFALVEAEGAQGAKVSSYAGVYVDWNGYAAVPYLNAWQLNEISLDPNGISADVELENTTQKVAPWAGAIVKLKYNTRHGRALLITATYEGEPVAFGAEVLDSKGTHVGMVGQGGEIYARVQEESDRLRVKWGDSPDMQCSLNYAVPPQTSSEQGVIQRIEGLCEADTVRITQPGQERAETPHDASHSHS
ncbi:fimbria/pilus outer membrane usher protein [Erwinia sp. CGal63]|uniref:fimbria/pilus outer membrane usher protein n=1 Tax=Erwinia sp. CGal63 TaxID=2919889 RepID=UPI00300955C7